MPFIQNCKAVGRISFFIASLKKRYPARYHISHLPDKVIYAPLDKLIRPTERRFSWFRVY